MDFLGRVWRVLRWPLGVLVVGFIALCIYRIPAVNEMQKSQETVAYIQSQRITLDDVMGKNLPPAPDQALNDSTVEGIDANENSIRDDVELAIFERYPNSPKDRAGELQYAKALQMEFTQVFTPETLVAVIKQEGRANICVLDSDKVEELEQLTFNTEARQSKRKEIYEKYMTSYSLPNEDFCDVDAATL